MIDTWTNPVFLRVQRGNQLIGPLLRRIEEGELLVPDYQRGRVWTDEQKSKWTGYVLSHGPLPGIFVREVNVIDGQGGRFRDEIVDGQQRLLALLDWKHGKIPAFIPWSGETAWCTTEMHERLLGRITIPFNTLPSRTSDVEVYRVYLALNSGGTPHTEADLAKVRALLEDS